ncbi:hypothetical protein CH293_11525 [Rhodococcus sp. 14-2470-1b]|uniref:hypothetical protein n=1 Tax=Rhodococcus sp. 14-2470-1b TaxID=2023149 RepID=UPI000B9C2256|nr:hypothetical protein [Rhodococcus sp. 14-2470-1b]OZF53132.1 hypothetical protein CH293_11525 [Rhodococcus sp. 14-2470-1b]
MATELAVAYVSIVPETSRLVPEFNRQVGPGLERSGREQGQRYGNAFSGAAGKLIGAASGLVAGAAIVAFANESIKSLQRIERINTQTETVIRSTGNAAKVSAEEVEGLAGELENLTATEAETIQQGANFLLTFKNIRNEVGDGNDIFNQTVGVMTDLSRATGTDMKAASLQLGKALNDPIKGISALARVGITFSAEQKKQIEGFVETNDILSAQKIVLGELESQFGGSAEAYAQTTEGKIELAKHALGTFGEAVTAQVLPPLAAIGTATAAAFNGLAEHSDEVLLIAGAFVAWKFIPPLMAQMSSSVGSAAARVGAFNTATTYMRTAAGRSQADVGRLTATMQVLGQQGGNIGRIGTAFTNASTQASRFATTAGLAAASGRAMQIAGSGIVGALGGPFGIAVLAAGAALFFWVKKNQEAKAAAEANEAAIQAISDTLDAQTGAVTQNTIAAQAKILADNRMIDSAKNYGIAAADLVNAHLDDADALAKVNPVIEENIRKSTEASNVYKSNAETYAAAGVSLDDLTAALGGNSDKYSEVEGKIDSYNTRMSAAGANETEKAASLDRLKTSLDQAGIGAIDLGESVTTTNGQLADSRQVTEDAAAAQTKGAETANAFTEAMDKYNDSAATAEDRTSALKAALDALNGNPLDLEEANASLNEAFDSTAEAVKPKEGEAAPTVNLDTNTIDVATEAGRRLLDVTVAQRDATLDAARAARDAAVANGDLEGSQAAATAVVEQSRQKFVEQIGTLGIVGDEAQRLADKYIGIPSVVSTLIEAPGDVETQLAMDILKNKVDLVPDDKSITVDTLDEEAKKRLEALGVKVRDLPDGNVEVYADTTAGQTVIDQLINTPRKMTVTIDTVRTAQAERDFRALGGDMPMQGPVAPVFNANGNLLEFFAGGGLSPMSSRRAQVVPPNTWRVVGDRPVNDEFFIPDTDQPQHVSIGAEWARRRGLILVDPNQPVRAFADGGIQNAIEAGRGVTGNRYLWGGTGPTNFDCSGFVGWLQQIAMGIVGSTKRPYTTYSLIAGSLAGLEPGLGPAGTLFQVGVSDEHMAATLEGHNAESGGSLGASAIDSGAAGAADSQFPYKFHLPNALLNPQPTPPAAPVEATDPATTALDSTITDSTTTSSTIPETAAATQPELFSVSDRLKKLGSDLSSVAVDAMLEQIPFGLGESRFLTTPLIPAAPDAFPKEDIANQLPVTPGHGNWLEDWVKALRRPASIPVFDQGGVVAPGINLINNKTGAHEALANVTGLLEAMPAEGIGGSGPDFSINNVTITGHDTREVMRQMNALQTRQMMRYGGKP